MSPKKTLKHLPAILTLLAGHALDHFLLQPIMTFKVAVRCNGGGAKAFWSQAFPQLASFIHFSRTPKPSFVFAWSALPAVIKPKSTNVIKVKLS